MKGFRAVAVIGGVALVAVSAVFPAQTGDLPQGWLRMGDHPENYEMRLDPGAGRTGKASATIKGKGPSPAGFGTLMQSIQAGEYKGKRIRLSGWTKAAGIAGWAGLWMRVDGPTSPGASAPAVLAFDNMQDRPIKGTSDWKRHEIVLDVAPEATFISFGILLSGAGQAWMDDLSLDVVGGDVPVTGHTLGAPNRKPVNLDFQS
jgi:hypothetical protein